MTVVIKNVFRVSKIFNTKCGYCISSESAFNDTAAIIFDDDFNEQSFDDHTQTIFDIAFIKQGYKKLAALKKLKKKFIYAKCSCKEFFFNGI